GVKRVESLADAPAVVSAVLDQVNNFPEILAHIASPEVAGLAVEAEPPNVPQADTVDLRRPPREFPVAPPGVVLGDSVGLARLGMIDVDPEDRGPPVARILTCIEGIIRRPAVAQRDVEVPIRTEQNAAAVVVTVRVGLGAPDSMLAFGVG